jgi:hypothetical protein
MIVWPDADEEQPAWEMRKCTHFSQYSAYPSAGAGRIIETVAGRAETGPLGLHEAAAFSGDVRRWQKRFRIAPKEIRRRCANHQQECVPGAMLPRLAGGTATNALSLPVFVCLPLNYSVRTPEKQEFRSRRRITDDDNLGGLEHCIKH